MAILDESSSTLFQCDSLKVDDDTARQLYARSKKGFFTDSHWESTADETAAHSIFDVLCEITFGFHTKGEYLPRITEAGVWIFSKIGGEFFGSAYEEVSNEADAQAILNRTIANAIEHTTANPKFSAELARQRTKEN